MLVKSDLFDNLWGVREQSQWRIEDILSREEGFSRTPYLCDQGYITVGIGTKLFKLKGHRPTDFPITITRAQAEEWCATEMWTKHNRLLKSSVGEIYSNLNYDRMVIIQSMAYQMGVNGVIKFTNMWNTLEQGNYRAAARHSLDSIWAEEHSPKRAARHAAVLRGGVLENYYYDS